MSKLADMAFKACQFSSQRCPRAKHGLDCRYQHRIACRQFADPLFEPALWRDIAVECWATSQVDDGDVF